MQTFKRSLTISYLLSELQTAFAALVSGQLLVMGPQILELEEIIIRAEVRRGLKEENARKALEKAKESIASSKLETIGDVSPELAGAIDAQGILSKRLNGLGGEQSYCPT